MNKIITKEEVDINLLKNWEKNPRSIKKEDFQRLKNQIETLGVYVPLVVDEDYTVLSGNMRLRAFRDLGYEKVWVTMVHAPSDEEKTRYALSANDEAGYYEEQQLAELLHPLKIDLNDYRINLGKPISITQLLSKFGADVVEDEAPELEEEVKSKLGEVYELGPHRLMCGDSTDPNNYKTLMGQQMASMMFTDPPYNVGYQTEKHEMIKNDLMSSEEFDDFLNGFLQSAKPYINGAVYICMSSSELDSLYQLADKNNYRFKDFIIWVKNQATLTRADYQKKYEPIYYGVAGEGAYTSPFRNLVNVWENLEPFTSVSGNTTTIKLDNYEIKIEGKVEGEIKKLKTKNNVWYFNKPTKSDEHPTMKPLGLVAEALRNSSKLGDTVIDPFLGSGSTLIACEQTGRVCYGLELDPKYCDVIRKRYAKFINKEEDWEATTPLINKD